MRENSKILISAAGGKVGQHVVTQLADKKISARAGVHSQAKATALRKTGIEATVLDFESLIGVTLPIAAHKADMNQTHIYNPRWPPHAKFHNGQTLSMSLLLGSLTIFLAWWPSDNVPTRLPAIRELMATRAFLLTD